MSGEFSKDERDSDLPKIASKLAYGFAYGFPSQIVKEAYYLAENTPYDQHDIIREAAGNLLDKDDEILHHQVFRYFEWEAEKNPTPLSVTTLVDKAMNDVTIDERFRFGITELNAALNYLHIIARNSDRPIGERYLSELIRVFDLLEANRDLLNEEYEVAGMNFNEHILEASMVAEESDTSVSQDTIDRLLMHVSSAMHTKYPTTSKIARAHIKKPQYRNYAEAEVFGYELFAAFESGNFSSAETMLLHSDTDIGAHVWSKIVDVYDVGLHNRQWVDEIINAIKEGRPEYFDGLKPSSSTEVARNGAIGRVMGLTGKHDMIEKLLDNFDIYAAVEIARAFGECEDYTGISLLLKNQNVDEKTRSILLEHFQNGIKTPHPTKKS